MTVREDLQKIISDAMGDSNNGNLSKFIADQIIAAGYTKPVSDAEAAK